VIRNIWLIKNKIISALAQKKEIEMRRKKTAVFVLSFFAGLILFAGCGAKQGGIASEPSKIDQQIVRTIVDYKGAPLGQEIPKWINDIVNDEYEALEQLPRFKDKIAVVAIENGNNLDLLKSWANNFSIQAQLSRQISNKISAEFGGGLQGDKNSQESMTFIREIVATLSQTKISGLAKEMDYWIKIRTTDKEKKTQEEHYIYYVVYSISKANLDHQIDVALGKVQAKNQEQTELKTEIIDSVKKLRTSELSDQDNQ
jgi:hypothetical protein